MKTRFTSEFFSGNRKRLRELFTGTAPIVITANGQLQRGGDTPYRFDQDANFWYLTGINDPDIVLVIDRDKEYLIVPNRSTVRETFDGIVTNEALQSRSGIQEIYDDKTGWEKLSTRLQKVKHLATIAPPPAYIDFYGFYTNPARAALVQRLKKDHTTIELLDLSPHLARMRMIKQPVEIDAIQVAIDITNASIKESVTKAKLAKYAYEYELEANLIRGFRTRGATGLGFDPIIAGGSRACQIHYLENNHTFAADELVLIDVSAEVEHYVADVARTYAISTPSRRQEAVHDAVAEVQSFALSLVKPGLELKEYESRIEHYMGEKLRELSLIKSIDSDAVRTFFPHRTSHFLGLTAHDAGDYDRPLEVGVVMTVEPGIYIAAEGIGVRLEDDILITEDGYVNLSGKLLSALD